MEPGVRRNFCADSVAVMAQTRGTAACRLRRVRGY
jgi:hypothetical protein